MFIISTKQHLECTQHFQMKIVQKLSRGTGFFPIFNTSIVAKRYVNDLFTC